MAFFTSQLWHTLKSKYMGGGPELEFQRYFTDELNQRFSFVCESGYIFPDLKIIYTS